MLKIPCKQCLKYPTCQNKQQIVCDDLFTYISNLQYLKEPSPIPYWKQIKMAFPKTIYIKHNDLPFFDRYHNKLTL